MRVAGRRRRAVAQEQSAPVAAPPVAVVGRSRRRPPAAGGRGARVVPIVARRRPYPPAQSFWDEALREAAHCFLSFAASCYQNATEKESRFELRPAGQDGRCAGRPEKTTYKLLRSNSKGPACNRKTGSGPFATLLDGGCRVSIYNNNKLTHLSSSAVPLACCRPTSGRNVVKNVTASSHRVCPASRFIRFIRFDVILINGRLARYRHILCRLFNKYS